MSQSHYFKPIYFLKPIRQTQSTVTLVLSVSPTSVTLDRSAPGNASSFTASLNVDLGSALAVTVSSSDPSVTVSPATFNLGGGNPLTRAVTLTGAAAGPDSVTVSVSAPGLTTRTIAISRPPVPLDMTVTPSSLMLDRTSPGNEGTFTVALNRVPDTAVSVTVNSSDASVTTSPASFSLSTGNPPSRVVTLTGNATGPSPVTITVVPQGLTSKTVAVTRPPFTPSALSGLALWFDASDASSITLDGSNNVSQWADKSGNGRNLSQSNITRRPSYTSSNTVNGIIVPRFDGVDDTLVTSTSFTSISQPTTQCLVVRPESGKTDALITDTVSGVRQVIFLRNLATGMFVSGGSVVISPLSASTSSANTILGVFNGASSFVRVNNSQQSISAATSGITTFRLGCGIEDSINFFIGVIAEVIVFSKQLDAQEISRVESYFRSKWGTP